MTAHNLLFMDTQSEESQSEKLCAVIDRAYSGSLRLGIFPSRRVYFSRVVPLTGPVAASSRSQLQLRSVRRDNQIDTHVVVDNGHLLFRLTV